MSRITKSNDMDVYRIRGGHGNHEWATICIHGWQGIGNDHQPREIGEILIYSSFGSWAYQWGHLGEPFKQWLATADDPGYIAEKFMGSKAYPFDGGKSVRELRRALIEKRLRHDLTKTEAREIWDWIADDEQRLTTSADQFCQSLIDAQSEIVPTSNAIRFLSEPWERTCTSLDRSFLNFWQQLWPIFAEQLRAELKEAEAATC